MGRKLVLAQKQKYSQDSKASQMHDGKFIKLRSRVEPRTYGQEYYLNTLDECDITIATGPAGCGKTWLVAHKALTMLLDNHVEKIIVTKPIIEAGGEKLGALPGEVEDKVGPHFQSILDCFDDHLGPTMTKALLDRGKIQFLPTAYCRGRDLKNSFILIDEAQNLTRKGLKLLLSRISEGSKMAINGDADQIDLPNISDSGLMWAIDSLRGKDAQIGVVEFSDSDIQRHPLIRVILTNLR